MFRRSIQILMFSSFCAAGFAMTPATPAFPANLLHSPSQSAAKLLSAYTTIAAMPEVAVAANATEAQSSQTWYIRPDGGSRHSSIMTSGQCDGLGDAPYPGTGVNQHCAFNDFRMLFQDGSYTYGNAFPGWGWIIAGGDTVIIRGSIGTGVSYRASGWNSISNYCDSTGCWGITGSRGVGPPIVPSGTAAQHTRILGENYASCSAQNARAQLRGGWGVGIVLQLYSTSYVDIGCVDITDFSNCGKDNDVVPCESGGTPLSDYTADGIELSNTSTFVTFNNVRIHGLASDGILGAPGTGFVANDLEIVGNADSGWNADDGSGQTGVGTLSVTNYNISWNGCVEEYPIIDPLPYFSCTDQSSGGYGDGFGTATVSSAAPGWQVSFDQGIVSYNTQDGLDALHVSGAGSSMTVTRTLAFGNEGQQIKAGAGAQATMQNNVIIGNCEALTSGLPIPGRPLLTQDILASPCRAGNTAVLLYVNPGLPAKYQNNTLFSQGSIGLEVEYGGATGNTNTLLFNNNIFVGFYNAPNNGNPAPIFSNSDLNMLRNPGASWTHNVTYGARNNWTCPGAAETAAICASPQLTDMSYHPFGYGNMAPSGGSPVVGAGVAIPGITTDNDEVTRPAPPSIGAYELASASLIDSDPPTTILSEPTQTQSQTPPPPTQTQPPPTQTPPPPTQTQSNPATNPPVPQNSWVRLATEGQTVTIPGGLTVRFGALAGTPPGNNNVSTPLAADSFDPPITLPTTMTFVVSNSQFGGADPAPNYVKELDVQITNQGSN
jgi:hypothetical protein